MEKKVIEEIVRNILEREGWDVNYNLVLNISKTMEGTAMASIDINTWIINLDIDERIERKLNLAAEKYNLDANNITENVLYYLLKHEKGHWEKAPINAQFDAYIFEGVSLGLALAGFPREKIIKNTPDVANMITDTIVNASFMNDGRFMSGVVATDAIGLMKAQSFGRNIIMELFIDAQLKFTGRNNTERALAESQLENYEDTKKYSKELLGAFIGKQLAEKAFSEGLSQKERKFALDRMQNPSDWEAASIRYAEVIAPFLSDGNKCGCKKINKKNSGKGPGEESDEIKREMIRSALDRGKPPLFATAYEVLDEIYKKEAGKIVVEFKKDEREQIAQKMTLVSGVRRLEENEKPRGIVWGKTIFEGKELDEPVFSRKEVLISTDQPLEPIFTGQMKDVLFIVDVSGSMGWSGKPLDGSNYDMALRALYATMNYLESIRKAAYLNYGLILFSTTTRFSGWKKYTEFDDIKKMAFTDYEGLGTNLDISVLEKAESRKHDNFLAVLISDNRVFNEGEMTGKLLEIISKGDSLAIIQTGDFWGGSLLARLRAAGAATVIVNDPKDIANVTLSVARNQYHKRVKTAPTDSSQPLGGIPAPTGKGKEKVI